MMKQARTRSALNRPNDGVIALIERRKSGRPTTSTLRSKMGPIRHEKTASFHAMKKFTQMSAMQFQHSQIPQRPLRNKFEIRDSRKVFRSSKMHKGRLSTNSKSVVSLQKSQYVHQQIKTENTTHNTNYTYASIDYQVPASTNNSALGFASSNVSHNIGNYSSL